MKHDQPYLLSMANSGRNQNGSQFFITLAPAPHLDGKHVVFGRAIAGFKTIAALAAVPTADAAASHRPLVPVVIESCGQLSDGERVDASDTAVSERIRAETPAAPPRTPAVAPRTPAAAAAAGQTLSSVDRDALITSVSMFYSTRPDLMSKLSSVPSLVDKYGSVIFDKLGGKYGAEAVNAWRPAAAAATVGTQSQSSVAAAAGTKSPAAAATADIQSSPKRTKHTPPMSSVAELPSAVVTPPQPAAFALPPAIPVHAASEAVVKAPFTASVVGAPFTFNSSSSSAGSGGGAPFTFNNSSTSSSASALFSVGGAPSTTVPAQSPFGGIAAAAPSQLPVLGASSLTAPPAASVFGTTPPAVPVFSSTVIPAPVPSSSSAAPFSFGAAAAPIFGFASSVSKASAPADKPVDSSNAQPAPPPKFGAPSFGSDAATPTFFGITLGGGAASANPWATKASGVGFSSFASLAGTTASPSPPSAAATTADIAKAAAPVSAVSAMGLSGTPAAAIVPAQALSLTAPASGGFSLPKLGTQGSTSLFGSSAVGFQAPALAVAAQSRAAEDGERMGPAGGNVGGPTGAANGYGIVSAASVTTAPGASTAPASEGGGVFGFGRGSAVSFSFGGSQPLGTDSAANRGGGFSLPRITPTSSTNALPQLPLSLPTPTATALVPAVAAPAKPSTAAEAASTSTAAGSGRGKEVIAAPRVVDVMFSSAPFGLGFTDALSAGGDKQQQRLSSAASREHVRVIVTSVAPGSPASAAGVAPRAGLLQIDGCDVSRESLVSVMGKLKVAAMRLKAGTTTAGSPVKLTFSCDAGGPVVPSSSSSSVSSVASAPDTHTSVTGGTAVTATPADGAALVSVVFESLPLGLTFAPPPPSSSPSLRMVAVLTVDPSSPAASRGVMPGDSLQAIDGARVAGMSLEGVRGKLKSAVAAHALPTRGAAATSTAAARYSPLTVEFYCRRGTTTVGSQERMGVVSEAMSSDATATAISTATSAPPSDGTVNVSFDRGPLGLHFEAAPAQGVVQLAACDPSSAAFGVVPLRSALRSIDGVAVGSISLAEVQGVLKRRMTGGGAGGVPAVSPSAPLLLGFSVPSTQPPSHAPLTRQQSAAAVQPLAAPASDSSERVESVASVISKHVEGTTSSGRTGAPSSGVVHVPFYSTPLGLVFAEAPSGGMESAASAAVSPAATIAATPTTAAAATRTIIVTKVTPGSPAASAGVSAGDALTAVNGIPVRGWGLVHVQGELRSAAARLGGTGKDKSALTLSFVSANAAAAAAPAAAAAAAEVAAVVAVPALPTPSVIQSLGAPASSPVLQSCPPPRPSSDSKKPAHTLDIVFDRAPLGLALAAAQSGGAGVVVTGVGPASCAAGVLGPVLQQLHAADAGAKAALQLSAIDGRSVLDFNVVEVQGALKTALVRAGPLSKSNSLTLSFTVPGHLDTLQLRGSAAATTTVHAAAAAAVVTHAPRHDGFGAELASIASSKLSIARPSSAAAASSALLPSISPSSPSQQLGSSSTRTVYYRDRVLPPTDAAREFRVTFPSAPLGLVFGVRASEAVAAAAVSAAGSSRGSSSSSSRGSGSSSSRGSGSSTAGTSSVPPFSVIVTRVCEGSLATGQVEVGDTVIGVKQPGHRFGRLHDLRWEPPVGTLRLLRAASERIGDDAVRPLTIVLARGYTPRSRREDDALQPLTEAETTAADRRSVFFSPATVRTAEGLRGVMSQLSRPADDSSTDSDLEEEEEDEDDEIISEEDEEESPRHSSSGAVATKWAASSAPPPKDFSDLAGRFGAAPGGWSCSVCLLSNNAGAVKCASCESPAPAGAISTTSTTAAAAPTAQFSFGGSGSTTSLSSSTKVAPALFSFGGAASSSTSFSFGFGSSTAAAPVNGGSGGFGSAASSASSASSTGTFGGGPTPTFSFGFGSTPAAAAAAASVPALPSRSKATGAPSPSSPESIHESGDSSHHSDDGDDEEEGEEIEFSEEEEEEDQSAQPTASAKPKDFSDLVGRFGPSSGGWTCSVCLVSNSAGAGKCVSCDSPAPGAALAAVPAATFPSAKAPATFSFGGAAAASSFTSSTSSSVPTFSFGFGATAAAAAAVIPPAAQSAPATFSFGFGSAAAAPAPVTAPFAFNTGSSSAASLPVLTPSAAPSAAFSFGGNAAATTAPSTLFSFESGAISLPFASKAPVTTPLQLQQQVGLDVTSQPLAIVPTSSSHSVSTSGSSARETPMLLPAAASADGVSTASTPISVVFTSTPLGLVIGDNSAETRRNDPSAPASVIFELKRGFPSPGLVSIGAGVRTVAGTDVRTLSNLSVRALLQAAVKKGISASSPLTIEFDAPRASGGTAPTLSTATATVAAPAPSVSPASSPAAEAAPAALAAPAAALFSSPQDKNSSSSASGNNMSLLSFAAAALPEIAASPPVAIVSVPKPRLTPAPAETGVPVIVKFGKAPFGIVLSSMSGHIVVSDVKSASAAYRLVPVGSSLVSIDGKAVPIGSGLVEVQGKLRSAALRATESAPVRLAFTVVVAGGGSGGSGTPCSLPRAGVGAVNEDGGGARTPAMKGMLTTTSTSAGAASAAKSTPLPLPFSPQSVSVTSSVADADSLSSGGSVSNVSGLFRASNTAAVAPIPMTRQPAAATSSSSGPASDIPLARPRAAATSSGPAIENVAPPAPSTSFSFGGGDAAVAPFVPSTQFSFGGGAQATAAPFAFGGFPPPPAAATPAPSLSWPPTTTQPFSFAGFPPMVTQTAPAAFTAPPPPAASAAAPVSSAESSAGTHVSVSFTTTPFGLNLQSAKYEGVDAVGGPTVRVAAIMPGTEAAVSVIPGDKVLTVDGVDVTRATPSDVTAMLRAKGPSVSTLSPLVVQLLRRG